jgi:hypothetical protein
MGMNFIKIVFALVIFTFTVNADAVSLILFNYTNQPGSVFLGNTGGPFIDTSGNPIGWAPGLIGTQTVALGSSGNICYLTSGPLILNAAAYKGDTISIIFGQQQIPNGIACSCNGSACQQG